MLSAGPTVTRKGRIPVYMLASEVGRCRAWRGTGLSNQSAAERKSVLDLACFNP
ncbi:hypothetical protein C7967_11157 [Thalassospira sp. 11-3]|nr:hypothetical protein KO164_4179 [Thalassospira sp. KO164]PXX27943.1 hypothetical protein C7967_11157 [Thalassospira sp. 11-3]SEE86694.1 hypothetical protein SAMN04515623_4232 [Thalassospira permensis]